MNTDKSTNRDWSQGINDIELMYILHSKEHQTVNNTDIYTKNLTNSERTVLKKKPKYVVDLDAIK